MAPRNASKPNAVPEVAPAAPEKTAPAAEAAPVDTAKKSAADTVDTDNLETVFSALKTLMTTVDKLQKSRQDVGDIKPLIIRMLDGELLSGDELETLKTGVSGLSKLVRIYSDYQMALEKAQPAREILDTVLK
ncbi:MAG: hypothetical protein AAF572_11210 [Cyanobacteria bacterium P01_B01_bin.77]